ncbi:MAG: hypothetical protein G01um101477_356 [Candidatus Doudnabacteria bacterium Gr01-1014_77]|uniref:Uncharacterized protein n=1 Tax=Candidatus Doudnabacteria bacterium Gr01-1014_77 TaxID=2017133 RepID=A0A554JBP9_9BACT|nr:MAG: hypothetical protein G01um101477_356 [Candidatus Doudnabacteria bacterium Gr01-1014_77]
MLPAHVLPSVRHPDRLERLGGEHAKGHVYDRTLYAYRHEIRQAIAGLHGVVLERIEGGASTLTNVEVLILPVVQACFKGMIDEDSFSFERLFDMALSFLQQPALGLEIATERCGFSKKGVLKFAARQKVSPGGRAADYQMVRLRVYKGRARAKRPQPTRMARAS